MVHKSSRNGLDKLQKIGGVHKMMLTLQKIYDIMITPERGTQIARPVRDGETSKACPFRGRADISRKPRGIFKI